MGATEMKKGQAEDKDPILTFTSSFSYADTLSDGMQAVPGNVAETGGYLATYTAKRTLQEAYSCLFT